MFEQNCSNWSPSWRFVPCTLWGWCTSIERNCEQHSLMLVSPIALAPSSLGQSLSHSMHILMQRYPVSIQCPHFDQIHLKIHATHKITYKLHIYDIETKRSRREQGQIQQIVYVTYTYTQTHTFIYFFALRFAHKINEIIYSFSLHLFGPVFYISVTNWFALLLSLFFLFPSFPFRLYFFLSYIHLSTIFFAAPCHCFSRYLFQFFRWLAKVKSTSICISNHNYTKLNTEMNNCSLEIEWIAKLCTHGNQHIMFYQQDFLTNWELTLSFALLGNHFCFHQNIFD